MPPRPPIQHLELEPHAADFLELMRDLGHLDAAAIEALTGRIVAEGRPQRRVGYDEVRRSVATWLFEHDAELRPEQRDWLQAEWPRLFH